MFGDGSARHRRSRSTGGATSRRVESSRIAEWFVLALARFSRVLWFECGASACRGPRARRFPIERGWTTSSRSWMPLARAGRPSSRMVTRRRWRCWPLRRTRSAYVARDHRRLRADSHAPTTTRPGCRRTSRSPFSTRSSRSGELARWRSSSARRSPTPRVSSSGGRGSSASGRRRGGARAGSRRFSSSTSRLPPLVEVPTLVVHSRDNMFVRVGHGRYLAEHIAGARLVELDSSVTGHCPTRICSARSRSSSPAPASAVDDADRVLATVLFTDVVGSTEHAASSAIVAGSCCSSSSTSVSGGARRSRGRARRHRRATASRHLRRAGAGDPLRGQIRDAVRRTGLEVRSGLHAGEVDASPERRRRDRGAHRRARLRARPRRARCS